MVCRGCGGFEHESFNLLATTEWLQFLVRECRKQFQLLRKTQNRPGLPTGPGAEAGVALLRIRATVGAILCIENRLVGRAAAFVVGIASLAIEDGIFGRGVDVLKSPIEQAHGLVTLGHEHMPELMSLHKNSAGTNGIHEERMRAVEAVDESPTLPLGPARRLNGTACFDGEFVEVFLPFVFRQPPLEHQAAKVSVG